MKCAKLSILPILCRQDTYFPMQGSAQWAAARCGVDSAGWLCSAACPRENNVSTMVRTNQLSLLTRRRVFEGITPVPVTPDNCAPGHRAVPRGILQPRVRARRVPSGPAAAARFITIHTVYTDYLILLRSVDEW